MAEAKTRPTAASVEAYLVERASPSQRADCDALIALLQKLTGEPPRLWGPSIVGFGSYRYRYASGRCGESCATGFAVRGKELVIYLVAEGPEQAALLPRLGRHKMGKACLYVRQLADLDGDVLRRLVEDSLAELRRRHPS